MEDKAWWCREVRRKKEGTEGDGKDGEEEDVTEGVEGDVDGDERTDGLAAIVFVLQLRHFFIRVVFECHGPVLGKLIRMCIAG